MKLKGRKMNLLFIGAHIDDIEIGCGGTVARAIKNGHSVKLVVMSHSSYSNYDGKVLLQMKRPQ